MSNKYFQSNIVGLFAPPPPLPYVKPLPMKRRRYRPMSTRDSVACRCRGGLWLLVGGCVAIDLIAVVFCFRHPSSPPPHYFYFLALKPTAGIAQLVDRLEEPTARSEAFRKPRLTREEKKIAAAERRLVRGRWYCVCGFRVSSVSSVLCVLCVLC